jgi:putative oxidoreductase
MVVHAGAMERSGKGLTIALWMSAIVAAVVFARVGVQMLSGAMIGQFEEWGYAPSFSLTIGVLELFGAIGLLVPRSSAQAALGLIVLTFGALGIRLLEGDYAAALGPTLMIGLLGFVLFGRGLARAD